MLKLKMLVAVTVMLVLLASQSACDKKQLIDYASSAVAALTEALPVFKNAGLDTSKLEQALNLANQLLELLKGGQNENALTVTTQLLTVFESLVKDTVLIKDPVKRTLALAFLAAAHVALQHIAQNISTVSKKVVMTPKLEPNLAKIRAFSHQRRWSCRSSITGKFVQMEQCKLHPDTTEVVGF